jgi:hypothetical protein
MLAWCEELTDPDDTGAAAQEGDYQFHAAGLPDGTHEWYTYYLRSPIGNGIAASMPEAKLRAEEAMNRHRASQQPS